jgi:uncharacterized damage-inducible protein DinB
MNLRAEALRDLAATRKFFERTTRCLDEGDSTFRAHPATMSVASHVAHVAQVADWFRAGAFDGAWNMDFEAQQAETDAVSSLAAARSSFDAAWRALTERLEAASDEELAAPMPDNPILGAVPRFHVVSAVVDHTGHHRGALAVCARLAGKTPAMPYGED